MRSSTLCAILLAGCASLQSVPEPLTEPIIPVVDLQGNNLPISESESEGIESPKGVMNERLKKLLERVKETPKGLFVVFNDDYDILVTTRNNKEVLIHEQQYGPSNKVSKMYDYLPYGSLNKFETCIQTHVKNPLTGAYLSDHCYEVISIEPYETLKFEMTVEMQLNALEMYDALDCTGKGIQVENGIYDCL